MLFHRLHEFHGSTDPSVRQVQKLMPYELQINFDNVAKAHGTNTRAAYMRLWTLRKKTGFTGASEAPFAVPDGEKAVNAAGKPGKKRGRPPGQGKGRKSKKQSKEVVEAENAGEDEGDDAEEWEKKEEWEQKDFSGSVKVEEDGGE